MIEDDSVLTEVIRVVLVDEGFAVSVCKRWEYALDLRFGDQEYGWRILDQLILDPATHGNPVIVSSGAVDSLRTDAPALLAQNGLFALPKPFNLNVMLRTVDKALAGSPRSAHQNHTL